MRGKQVRKWRKAAVEMTAALKASGIKHPYQYFRDGNGVIRCPHRGLYRALKKAHTRRKNHA